MYKEIELLELEEDLSYLDDQPVFDDDEYYDEYADLELIDCEEEDLTEDSERNREVTKKQQEEQDIIPTITWTEAFRQHKALEDKFCKPVETGFPTLDKALGEGIQGLCVVGGLTGIGKSAFGLQLAEQIAANIASTQRMQIYYFTLEMEPIQLLARSVSRKAYFEHGLEYTERDIHKFFSIEELPAEIKALYSDSMSNIHYSFLGNSPYTIKAIVEALKQKIRRKPDDKHFFVIDYLQIAGIEEHQAFDRRHAIDKDMSTLSIFCKQNGVSGIVVSSLNRENYKESISLKALKESGNVEYSADQIIGLQLKGTGTKDFKYDDAITQNPRNIEAVVLKTRFGQTGQKVDFKYYPAYNYFKCPSDVCPSKEGYYIEKEKLVSLPDPQITKLEWEKNLEDLKSTVGGKTNDGKTKYSQEVVEDGECYEVY